MTTQEEIDSVLRNCNPQQIEEYMKFQHEINKFALEMGLRFAHKILTGRKGWTEASQEDIATEIDIRTQRLIEGEESCDIGIANWAFIHWYNRQ